jgi:hypothetical protein
MFDLKGHHRRAAIPVHLRFPISDLRNDVTERIPQGLFNIQRSSKPVRKIVKVSQGKSRVFSSKKFRIFFGAHSWEIIWKSRKTAQKPLQNHSKSMRVMACFQYALKSQKLK